MALVVLLLCALVVAMAAGAIFVRSLGSAVIFLSSVSLFASLIFLVLAAPDVAITEAAIGSALTTVVYVLALVRTGSVPWENRSRKIAVNKDAQAARPAAAGDGSGDGGGDPLSGKNSGGANA